MKKVGYFFFCFLPMLASFALQFAAVLPVLGFILLGVCYSHVFSGVKISYNELVMQLSGVYSNPSVALLASICFAACGILIFGIWYVYQFGGDLRQPSQIFSHQKVLIALALLVPGLQILSSILTAFSASLFPGWMEFYEKLMETVGFTGSGSVSLLLVLYAVLLGPIEEEFLFRGVIFSSAKKALPFWAANLFQALLFGLFHLNLIQGIYAFFIGLFLGFVCSRSGSIYYSVFLHILFNGWGTFVSAGSVMLIGISIICGIAGFILFCRNTSPAAVKHPSDFSDI